MPATLRPNGDRMKYHVTHCGGCGALMLCDKAACAPPDHICYVCMQPAHTPQMGDARATAAEFKP